jgi:hypothetical protein
VQPLMDAERTCGMVSIRASSSWYSVASRSPLISAVFGIESYQQHMIAAETEVEIPQARQVAQRMPRQQ